MLLSAAALAGYRSAAWWLCCAAASAWMGLACSCSVEIAAFRCHSDAQCVDTNTSGRCEPIGLCSFPDAACADTGRRYGELGLTQWRNQCVPKPRDPVEQGMFRELFEWSGPHAAIVEEGEATTVWWNPDHWDARSDTSPASIRKGGGVYVDIHRGSRANRDGSMHDDVFFLGGNATAGVGIMRVDTNSVVSARLRHMALISSDTPLSVAFFASALVTVGHWWEIAITPAFLVVGGEMTALHHRIEAGEDAINVYVRGASQTPCADGWAIVAGVIESHGGVRTAHDAVTLEPAGAGGTEDAEDADDTEDARGRAAPFDAERLVAWKLDFAFNGITLAADFDDDGLYETQQHFAVDIPASFAEVHVHLLSVAHDAALLPQGETAQGETAECIANRGPQRDFAWKNVSVGPVAYAKTVTHPKDSRTARILQDTEWMFYDLRDTARRGRVGDRVQPNLAAYDELSALAFCSDATRPGCSAPVPTKVLHFVLPESDAEDLDYAALLYDVRGDGTGALNINGHAAGILLNATSVFSAAATQWVHRSFPVDPTFFKAGDNTIEIEMRGNVQFDRLEFEFATLRADN